MDEETLIQSTTPRPSFQLHSPAVDFIENRLPEYHPAFDARHVRFSPSQGQFVVRRPPPFELSSPQSTTPASTAGPDLLSLPRQSPRPAPVAVNEMQFWHDIFPKAMEMLNADPSCAIKDPAWKIRHLSTWADVQETLIRAQRQYDFHSNPRQVGRFRRKVRSVLDDNTAKLQQISRLVPEVDIAKPVVGAVKVVLDAYRQASEVREELATSFDELPEAFENMEFYRQTYREDENIASASCNLVCAVLTAIENAVAFYTSHQAKRAGMAVLTGSEYQKNLLGSLQEIKSRCGSLENQARMSLAHRVASDSSSILERQAIMEHVLGSIDKGMRMHNMEMRNLGMSLGASLFNLVYSLLSGHEGARRSPSPLGRSPSPLPQLLREEAFWSPRDIWARLRIPAVDEEDLGHIAANAELMLHMDRGRAQQLMGEPLFRRWMSAGGSARLLVHGDFQPPFDTSPLSVVCSLLTHTFRNLGGGFVSLVFFCGRHQIWDAHRGGSAIIRSLIDQLLRQCMLDSIRAGPDVYLEDVDRGDLKALCEVFVLLFRQLPSHLQVFCLIDGICLYETDQYLDGMGVVIMSLISLVESGGYGLWPTLKLLITSPSPTVEVRKVFDPEPDTLLCIQGPSLVDAGMGLAGLQEQFDRGIRRME
ncbi:hypothetical protein LX36DRAFT_661366 [Colletotrichum falcatum]|nr:hypothetical protein LX36DRAFT_661366 [Colletotrichum falcatum]